MKPQIVYANILGRTMRCEVVRKSGAELSRQIAAWNAHRPIGTEVQVMLDDDTIRTTKTRSEAWVMGGHSAVILLEGISGAYSLDRVKPL